MPYPLEGSILDSSFLPLQIYFQSDCLDSVHFVLVIRQVEQDGAYITGREINFFLW